MNKKKKMRNRILAVIVSISMLLSMEMIQPQTVHAYMKSDITQTVNSTLSDLLPYSWDAELKDGVLTVNLIDTMASLDCKMSPGSNCAAYMHQGKKIKDYKEFTGNKCTVSGDFSKSEGIETVSVYVYLQTDVAKYLRWNLALYLDHENGKVSIYNTYGAASVATMQNLMDNYKPEDCLKTRTPSRMLLSHSYDTIKEKTEEITKNCVTEGDKVKTIHDWICKNITYDMDQYLNGTTSKKYALDRAIEDKLAVCAGFAELAETMYRFAGIPCVTITGIGDTTGVLEDGTETKKSSNHAWNAIYYNNAWHYMDLTWDCGNRYYGEGDSRNHTDKDPTYRYFGMPADRFGLGHYAMEIKNESEEGIGLELENIRTQYYVGDTFVPDYKLYIKTTSGYRWNAGSDKGICTGYDMNTPGKQTVTVTYRGLSTTYPITVIKPDHIKVVPHENAVYLKGGEFKPDFDLYIVGEDGSENKHENMSNVTCTGYDMNKVGKQTVTVSYNGMTTEYEIEVVDAAGISVEVAEQPVAYAYDSKFEPYFDLYVTKSDGTKVLVENGASQAECSGYDMEKLGEQEVTVKYLGFTAKYKITVVYVVAIDCVVANKTFEQGQEFSTDNNKIYYIAQDGKKYLVQHVKPTYSGYNMDKTGIQKVKVSCGGFEATYYITVKAKETPTVEPTVEPTVKPTTKPIVKPTVKPTAKPTTKPTIEPTVKPTTKPTAKPTIEPTRKPNGNTDNKVPTTVVKNPKGTQIVKIKAGSKKLTVTIKAQKAQTNGYQIRYSLKKNMKGAKMVTLNKNTKLLTTIKNLKAGKKYYVQVRTYRTVEKKKYYSGWSKVVSEKTLR